MPTLLEMALASPAKRAPDSERVDLALAYYNGVLTDSQVAEALGCSPSSAASQMSRTLRWAIKSKTIKELEKSDADKSE